MSKFNREKRALWTLKLHKKFLGFKLVGKELDVALRTAKKGIGIRVPKENRR